jgi:hypothetical protein
MSGIASILYDLFAYLRLLGTTSQKRFADSEAPTVNTRASG